MGFCRGHPPGYTLVGGWVCPCSSWWPRSTPSSGKQTQHRNEMGWCHKNCKGSTSLSRKLGTSQVPHTSSNCSQTCPHSRHFVFTLRSTECPFGMKCLAKGSPASWHWARKGPDMHLYKGSPDRRLDFTCWGLNNWHAPTTTAECHGEFWFKANSAASNASSLWTMGLRPRSTHFELKPFSDC